MLRSLTTAFAVLALAATGAMAQDTESKDTVKKDTILTIGSKAPSIKDVAWIKGDGIDSFKRGDAYLVECWATWCGPCIRGIPHLTKLQKTYKGKVKIMGVAVWEKGDDAPVRIKSFVKDQGDKMDYTVGYEKNDSIAKNWLKPAGQNGIPTAFLVGKDGRIEWIGHPGGVDDVLKQYTEGTWNREAYAKEFKAEQEREIVMARLFEKLEKAQAAGDSTTVIKLIDGALKDHPEMTFLKQMKFVAMLESDGKSEDAYAYGERLLKENWDDAQWLNSISWNILTDERIKYRNPAFALKAAERANNLTDGKDAAILDTLARAWFDKGNVEKAIATQEKAISQADAGPMKNEMKTTLENYMKAAPKVS